MKLRLYGCGGAGINLCIPFLEHKGKQEAGFAEIDVCFIDTSDANLRKVGDAGKAFTYRVPGASSTDMVDGSGMKRTKNFPLIKPRAKEMLQAFKPGDINVVVSSISGGSGSVISPTLTNELLNRGLPTIVIMVGSTTTSIETKNSLETISGFEDISQARNAPVIAVYHENTKSTPQGTVNQRIRATIVLLAAIFSGENDRLDRADIENFLNYNEVTDFEPGLTNLDFFNKTIEVQQGHAPVAVLTLTDDTTDHDPGLPLQYQAHGIVSAAAKSSIKIELPLHATLVANFFSDLSARLERDLATVEEIRNAVVVRPVSTKRSASTGMDFT